MTGNEIREKFLKYFAEKGHEIVESSPLVPQDDPTLLFTNAGMVQFKRLFMGEEKRKYIRATTSQRCVRAGGKHNDLENVGYTARHHTFFEMLGNFSFGDYFKEDAIKYAWEFLIDVVGLDKSKLWISVFLDDDEAFDLWQTIAGVSADRIVRLGEDENFWAMGDTGPCGPCSEIHFDQGEEMACGPDCKMGCDCDRFLEIWNLVFMQFNRSEDGTMTPLPKPSIDTGMGLERIAAVVQGKFTNYDGDLFTTIFDRIGTVTGKKYGENDKADTAMKVIADHSRATTFLVADGVLPSNEGRGYVLRRIMRRAIRFGRFLGMEKPFLAEITDEVINQMVDAYPHLKESRELLNKVVNNEEERFLETIDHGLVMLNDELQRIESGGEKIVEGGFIFKLYDTYGFPMDIVRDLALERGLSIDEAGFHAAMEVQREQSKKSWKGKSLDEVGEGVQELLNKGEQTEFRGYETVVCDSVVSGLIDQNGKLTDKAAAGDKVVIVFKATPFYAESGGQCGDQGEIAGKSGKAKVTDTVYGGTGLVLHIAEIVEGSISNGEDVTLGVDSERRQSIANNHTATHLLQASLVKILGDHVKQSGSVVDQYRLRFDFTNFSPVTPGEIEQVEAMVNSRVRANASVITEVLDREEAINKGATALFGEKYEDEVRVVSVPEFSKELCGGTHVRNTGEIGVVKIVSEGGIAAGVRRIEAITGPAALDRFQSSERSLRDIAGVLKASPDDIMTKVEKLLARQKELEKELVRAATSQSANDLDDIIAKAEEIDGIKVVSAKVQVDSPKTLRDLGDKLRDRLGSGVAVLGAVLGEKVSLLAIVSKDLTDQYHAGNLIKEVARVVGGSGGGRPDMAQAGGTMPDKLDEAIASVVKFVKSQKE